MLPRHGHLAHQNFAANCVSLLGSVRKNSRQVWTKTVSTEGFTPPPWERLMPCRRRAIVQSNPDRAFIDSHADLVGSRCGSRIALAVVQGFIFGEGLTQNGSNQPRVVRCGSPYLHPGRTPC